MVGVIHTMKRYEIIDHTSEMGVKAYGQSRQELFTHMAQGMVSLIVPLEEIRPVDSISIEVHAEDWDRLLMGWLKELIYTFDTKHFLPCRFDIHELTSTSLTATASGETLDLARHHVGREVKAVTYCELKIAQDPDGRWTAQVIFDV